MNTESKEKAIVLGVGPEKGLGAALCHRFADEGLHVFVAGRTAEKIDQIVRSIDSNGGSATPIVCDGTSESDVKRLFSKVHESEGGELQLAVFNVGNNMPGPIRSMTAEYFEQAWRTVCFSGFLFGREVVNAMQGAGGTLLFTGASASLRGKANFGAFNSAKSALRSYAQALAKEHAPDGIHIGHVIVDGGIAGEKAFTKFPEMAQQPEKLVSLEGLADAYWFLHQQQRQSWTFELDLRTSLESW
ncbi:MAG: SDR family NAD(P)-dependent oxidoreductase [Acidiferrobacterales bacterium]|nr:SDR family NAD(P)-dependent oxidoreductase [Acidiferrobacterales bacterium]